MHSVILDIVSTPIPTSLVHTFFFALLEEWCHHGAGPRHRVHRPRPPLRRLQQGSSRPRPVVHHRAGRAARSPPRHLAPSLSTRARSSCGACAAPCRGPRSEASQQSPSPPRARASARVTSAEPVTRLVSEERRGWMDLQREGDWEAHGPIPDPSPRR